MKERLFLNLVLLWIASVCFTAGCILVAHSHGSADWIQKGNYKDGGGNLCCGVNDCDPFPEENVHQSQTGFKLSYFWAGQPREEFIELRDTKDSIDRQYWRCHFKTGNTRCFFAPPGWT